MTDEEVRGIIKKELAPYQARIQHLERVVFTLARWAAGGHGRAVPPVIGDAIKSVEQMTWCENCGAYLEEWACGPGHAIIRGQAGLEWNGIIPGTPTQ